MATFAKTTYSHASYAAFRPTYPAALFDTILAYHRGPRNLCLDLGCGHGIATREFARHFDKVLGTDPSEGMIAQAKAAPQSPPNVTYRMAAVEDLSFLQPESIDLVVAAQAAHWFDFTRAWPELHRVLRKGGTLAFFGYKDHHFVDYPLATRIMLENAHSRDPEALGYYWQQPGRTIVEDKLRAIKPPDSEWADVERLEYEPGTKGPHTGTGTLFVSKKLDIEGCKAYIRTWSSYHGWKEAHPDAKKRGDGGDGDVVDQMFDQMAAADPGFDDPGKQLELEWGSGLLLARRR
jgi:SAM-dependent methyltransferase